MAFVAVVLDLTLWVAYSAGASMVRHSDWYETSSKNLFATLEGLYDH
jgi:hypothetical protein